MDWRTPSQGTAPHRGGEGRVSSFRRHTLRGLGVYGKAQLFGGRWAAPQESVGRDTQE